MKEGGGQDFLAIAWEYSDQELEVIPAAHSRMTKPSWPVTCANDSDCDDGVWCNGKLAIKVISHFSGLWCAQLLLINVVHLFRQRIMQFNECMPIWHTTIMLRWIIMHG